MTAIYTIPITKGETFFLEIVVKNEDGTGVDLTYANISVDVEQTTSLAPADFTISTATTAELGTLSTIKIRAADTITVDWEAANASFQVWLNWPAEDVEDEIIFNGAIAIKEQLQ